MPDLKNASRRKGKRGEELGGGQVKWWGTGVTKKSIEKRS